MPVVPDLHAEPVEIRLELPPEPELLSLEAVHRYRGGCASRGGPGLEPQLTVLNPHRAVALELQANREPDFSSLVPPLSPRRMAARVFYLLLGEHGHLCVPGAGRRGDGGSGHTGQRLL